MIKIGIANIIIKNVITVCLIREFLCANKNNSSSVSWFENSSFEKKKYRNNENQIYVAHVYNLVSGNHLRFVTCGLLCEMK